MNDQLNQSGQLTTPMTAARPIPEGMTVLRLGQYGRPSLATAGLLVWYQLPKYQVELTPHHMTTSWCHGHVDELATELSLLLYHGCGTGCHQSWTCCSRQTHFAVD